MLKLISCLSTLQRHLLIFHSYNSKIPSLFSLGRDFLIHKATVWRFPHGSVSKESACNAGDLALIPGSEISPEEGNDNPLLYLCLGNPMDRGVSWATFHGVTRVAHDLVTKLPPPRVLCSLPFSRAGLRRPPVGRWERERRRRPEAKAPARRRG